MTVSGANITVPKPHDLSAPAADPGVDQAKRDNTALFERLRALKASCGNKHEQAIVLISACVLEGINTRPRIKGALGQLGFNKIHIDITLTKETGNDPQLHRWYRDPDGFYVVLDQSQP